MKTISFKTVGCRLNQAETAELSEQFADRGFRVLPFGEPTHIVIIHTCAVTSRAEKDCVRIARACSRRKTRPYVVLTGCAAQVSNQSLKEECEPDLIVGQADKYDLPRKLAEIHNVVPDSQHNSAENGTRTRAIVKIQSGCDFHCAYCIVPAARDTIESVPANQVLERVKELASRSFKEIILTGANLGCYGTSTKDLIQLLGDIEQTEGVQRIRLSSIEITTAERQLIEYMKTSEKICAHLHVPLQSGSNTVLSRMNRKYTTEEYRDFCLYALEEIPGLALGTDVIVGFPGESESEFKETRQLIEDIPFSNLHVFQYSIRSGTPAADMPDQISSHIKKERSDCLLELGSRKKSAFAERLVGKPCSVLIEKIDDAGHACGWTREYIRAEIASENRSVNDIVEFVPCRQANGVLMAN